MNLGMEDERTEHKRSTSEMREAMESVASILNKHGSGTLYFGVRPSDGEVVGQDVSEKTLRDISQAFTNRIEPRVVPAIERLETEDGRAYAKVSFAGDDRPYACDGRYRIRSADEDLPIGAALLEQMMLERAAEGPPGIGVPLAGQLRTWMRTRCGPTSREALSVGGFPSPTLVRGMCFPVSASSATMAGLPMPQLYASVLRSTPCCAWACSGMPAVRRYSTTIRKRARCSAWSRLLKHTS